MKLSTKEVETFVNALSSLTKREPRGALLSIKQLRQEANMPKDRFDLIANSLYENNVVTMHYDDAAMMKKESEREQMVHRRGKEGDIYFIGIAFRR